MFNIVLDDRNPSVSSILAGISKGKIWYDDLENPTLAITYSYCVGGCGIVGKINKDSIEEVTGFFEKVFQSLRQNRIYEFEFSSEDNELYKDVLEIFSNKKIMTEIEYSYRIDHKIPEDICNLSREYQYRMVDLDFIDKVRNGTIANHYMLTDRIENSWDSYEDFLKKSKACIALHNNMIIGIIFGSSRYKKVIDVDIETLKEYQRKGIATRLTMHFVNNCMEDGLTIQWDHTESNKISGLLAKKCGFKLLKKRPYYWFDI